MALEQALFQSATPADIECLEALIGTALHLADDPFLSTKETELGKYLRDSVRLPAFANAGGPLMSAIEDHVFDFLEESIAAANDPSPLVDAELHDTLFREITKDFGVRIGDGESTLEPNSGDTEVLEFDGTVPLVIFSVATGADRSDRKDARDRMIALAKAVSKLFLDDPTMNGRVNDSRVTRCPRGWDSIKSMPYSVANMDLLVNETGGPVGH